MLRAGSVEIPMIDKDSLTMATAVLVGAECAIEQEMVELHDARSNMDYLSYREENDKTLSEMIQEQDGYLILVRSALAWLGEVRNRVYPSEVTHGQ